MAYGELNLKPWEFGALIPRQFFLMVQGYRARRSDQEEMHARFTAFLASMWTAKGKAVQTEDVLGRPLRYAWEQAQKKKKTGIVEDDGEAQTVAERLAQKDRERADRARSFGRK